MASSVTFEITNKNSQNGARTGVIHTFHGDIETPYFFPVGTKASVKSLSISELQTIGVQGVLANTYHLHLRPGEDIIKKFGGLAEFMSWHGPTMTDSGGYQVFSLGAAQAAHSKKGKKLNKFSKQEEFITPSFEEHRLERGKAQSIKAAKMDEEGVTFYSHLDGTKHRLSPDISIRMQEKIGADLIVTFDDHESPLWSYEETKASLERTNRWGLESLAAQTRTDQLMYGVVHGGSFQDLRIDSAKFTNEHFPAIAIGGSYTSNEVLYKVLDWTIPHLAEDKPRHLFGIGEVKDIFQGVARGIDTFDCVVPTRMGRMGNVFVHAPEGRAENSFRIDLTKSAYAQSHEPIDSACECDVCKTYTRGYIHHLFRARELLGYTLASYHNVYFLVQLMEDIRNAIKSNTFSDLVSQWGLT